MRELTGGGHKFESCSAHHVIYLPHSHLRVAVAAKNPSPKSAEGKSD